MAVVMAYKVLEASSREELEALVKDAIGRGWQPQGGLAINDGRFYQAMIGS